MKTKNIPAVVMLLAGAVACVIGIAQKMETVAFMEMLLVVLLVFYAFGCAAKIVLDKNFKMMDDEPEEAAETDGQEENEKQEEKTDSDGE